MNDDNWNDDDDLDIPEITNWEGGVVGKYYTQAIQSSNVVRLDPDVAAEFPDSGSVNRTLRRVARARQRRRERAEGVPK